MMPVSPVAFCQNQSLRLVPTLHLSRSYWTMERIIRYQTRYRRLMNLILQKPVLLWQMMFRDISLRNGRMQILILHINRLHQTLLKCPQPLLAASGSRNRTFSQPVLDRTYLRGKVKDLLPRQERKVLLISKIWLQVTIRPAGRFCEASKTCSNASAPSFSQSPCSPSTQ